MTLKRLLILLVLLALSSCATNDNRGRISELEGVDIDIQEVNIEGGLDKAMASYQKFLEQTPESELTPEAMRRLADLKVEKEYGIVTDGEVVDKEDTETAAPAKAKGTHKEDNPQEVNPQEVNPQEFKAQKAKEAPNAPAAAEGSEGKASEPVEKISPIADVTESQKDFEKRATEQQAIPAAAADSTVAMPAGEPGADLQNAGAAEAIELYNKLLAKYPMYERNDQVLYQLSRAYEETSFAVVSTILSARNIWMRKRLIAQYWRLAWVQCITTGPCLKKVGRFTNRNCTKRRCTSLSPCWITRFLLVTTSNKRKIKSRKNASMILSG
jgi:hypothetical protein